MNRRTGKVARLPKELRDQVNAMLMDGVAYPAICSFLDEHGHDVAPNNMTKWHQGGFQDWLKEQERIEDMSRKREFALDIVKNAEGSKLHEATVHIAASQLYEVLTDFDVAGLKDLMKKSPKNYPAVVNSLAKLAKQSLETEKFKEQVRTARERIERELNLAKDKGGISDETLAAIRQELKLF